MENCDIAITGIGLLTPAGVGPDDSWAGLCRGESFAATDPLLAGLRSDFSCRFADFSPTRLLGPALTRRLDVFSQSAVVAARQAVRDAGLDPDRWAAERVGVVLGVGSNSLQEYAKGYRQLADDRAHLLSPLHIVRSVPSMPAAEVALDLGVRGTAFTTASACASGTTALGTAMDLLRAGRCDIVLAGGSETTRDRMAAALFARMGALSARRHDPAAASRPFDRDRDGFVLGEGASVTVLERAEDARRRGARVRGYLAGYGAGSDAHHPAVPDPDGYGAEAAIRAALADARCTPQDIEHINAHGTSTPLNDESEAKALRRVFPSAPPVTANKSIIGHSLGAAGAVEAALTILSLQHQAIPPTANLERQESGSELDIVSQRPRPLNMTTALSLSCGFGGLNAALVLRAA